MMLFNKVGIHFFFTNINFYFCVKGYLNFVGGKYEKVKHDGDDEDV